MLWVKHHVSTQQGNRLAGEEAGRGKWKQSVALRGRKHHCASVPCSTVLRLALARRVPQQLLCALQHHGC